MLTKMASTALGNSQSPNTGEHSQLERPLGGERVSLRDGEIQIFKGYSRPIGLKKCETAFQVTVQKYPS